MGIALSDIEPSRLTVLGAGRMGAALTRAFLASGRMVTVWNRSPQRAAALVIAGAVAAETFSAAVAASDLLVVCLDAYGTWSDLCRTLPAGSLRGKVVVQLTTGTPAEARAFGETLIEAGARPLDGAILAYPKQVGSYEARLFLSGEPQTFQEAEPALSAIGRTIFAGSQIGAANAYDNALLFFSCGSTLAFFQSLAILVGHGVDARGFADRVAEGAVMRDALHASEAAILSRSHTGTQATLDVHLAALDVIRRSAEAVGARTAFLDAAHDCLRRARDAGRGREELSAVFEIMRPPSGGESDA